MNEHFLDSEFQKSYFFWVDSAFFGKQEGYEPDFLNNV